MTRIEKIISLYTALTGDATVTPVEVNKYAGLSESVSLEAISATITADSPINFGAMPVNDLLNYLFVNLFGKTQAEVDALRATTEGAAGFQYWADEIANNPQVINLNTLAIALLNGAEAAEANGNGTDATNAAKKVEGSVADYNAAYPDSGNPSETEGQTFTMTDGRDTITGTAGNDTINAFVGQNKDGALANAFATGDYIDGGAGTDTLFATLMNDNEVDSGYNFDINVRTKNVEIAKFEVLDEGVVVDAGTMDSVKEFWSVNSDDSGLTLEDVRLGSKLSITKDITFGMKDVDYGSDLTVGFDSNSFKNSGEKKFNSKIVVEVGDSNKDAGSTNPLELIKLTLEFTFDGQDYKFEDMTSVDGTYEGLKAAITTALSDKGLSNLVVSFGNSLTQIVAKNDTVDLLYSGAKQIVITDPNGEAFTNFKSGVAAKPSEESSNPVSNTNAMDPNNSSTLIESNLILDNAGRGSTAGDVVIGAMSNSKAGIEQFNVTVQGTNGSAIASLKTTHDKLQNIIIKSAVDSTASLEIGKTQDNLKLIDASGFKGTDLMLGKTTEDGNTVGELDEDNTDTSGQAPIADLTTLNANIAANVTFDGSILDGANYTYTTGTGNDTIKVKVDGDAVDTIGEGLAINAGNGNNTVTVDMQGAKVSVATTQWLNNLSITTGTGADKVELVGGSSAGTKESFTIAFTAGSTNTADATIAFDGITVTLANGLGNATAVAGDFVTKYNADIAGTQKWVAVNNGDGTISFTSKAAANETDVAAVDFVYTPNANTGTTLAVSAPTNYVQGVAVSTVSDGDADFNISTGAGSDFVYINSINDSQSVAAAKGTWTVGTETGAQTFGGADVEPTGGVNGKVLYKAELTVTFAGFESKVVVNTTAANNFVATQIDINNAIIAAIKANPELSKLLTTTLGTGHQQLTINSTVEGFNYLTIDLVQPRIEESTGVTAGVLKISSADVLALQKGLISTGEAASSVAVDSETKIVNLIGDKTVDSVIGSTGADESATKYFATTSSGVDETNVTNVSTINLGAGANDLVVLNSHDGSANTIIFSAAWDKVSVVNFFTAGADGQATTATVAEGLHKLDFTAFLGNQTDASVGNGNTLSAVTVATVDSVVAVGTGASLTTGNTVNIINDAVFNTTTDTWAGLTGAKLLAAIQETNTGTANYAGIVKTTLDIGVVGATLVGTTLKSLVMIENSANDGEYKVFELTAKSTTALTTGITDFTDAKLVGTVDFGDTIDAGAVFA